MMIENVLREADLAAQSDDLPRKLLAYEAMKQIE